MRRVLVVEPEPVVRALVAGILAKAGYEAVAVETGERAAEVAAGAPVDLVLVSEDAAALVRAAHPGPIVSLASPFGAQDVLTAVTSALDVSPKRVLVAEDHPAVRASLVAFLDAQDGMAVVGEAENGWEAVKLARQESPDFVLMDIRMPVMDGIEATRMVKSLRPETRIVLLSAYEQDELIDSGLEAGADGFLLKGASGSDLVALVREAGRCTQ